MTGLLLCAITALFALQPTTTDVSCSVQIPKEVRASKIVTGVVSITIPKGFHAYQNPPTSPEMIPLSVKANTKLSQFRIRYPKGAIETGFDGKPVAVYSGVIKVPIEFLAPTKPGSLALELEVRFQLCDDSTCFPPSSAVVKTKLQVKR